MKKKWKLILYNILKWKEFNFQLLIKRKKKKEFDYYTENENIYIYITKQQSDIKFKMNGRWNNIKFFMPRINLDVHNIFNFENIRVPI